MEEIADMKAKIDQLDQRLTTTQTELETAKVENARLRSMLNGWVEDWQREPKVQLAIATKNALVGR